MSNQHFRAEPRNTLAHTEVQQVPGGKISIDAASLKAKTGLVQRLGAAIATSRAAGDALRRVETERIRVESMIALTGLKLAEAKIKTALVSAAMPQIGALAMNLNSATMAVDEGLTNGAAAEVISHIQNRAANSAFVTELQNGGTVTDEEAATLRSFTDNDAAIDIENSRLRMAQAKDAVRTLHAYALTSIAKTKVEID